MIASTITSVSEKIRAVAKDSEGGPFVLLYLCNDAGKSGATLSMGFDDARRLATQIENAIAAHNCAITRSEDDDATV